MRAAPSREMLLHLAERLDVPLRERNAMLLAAGFAPVYAERTLEDPAMAAAREVPGALRVTFRGLLAMAVAAEVGGLIGSRL